MVLGQLGCKGSNDTEFQKTQGPIMYKGLKVPLMTSKVLQGSPRTSRNLQGPLEASKNIY